MAAPIYEGSAALGAHQVFAEVAPDHDGPCAMFDCYGEATLCVLPSYDQARIAASYGISPDGGYCQLLICDPGLMPVTHHAWQEWAFGP